MKITQALKNELRRALRNFKYETTDGGVFFPSSRILFGGVFSCRIDGGPLLVGRNAVATQFVNMMLNTTLGNAAAPAAWYVAPFTSSTAPTTALTGATFTATQTEYTGYTQSTRQQWVKDALASAQAIQNANAPASFTIGTGGATITGAGLLSTSAKSDTTGTLAAAGLFSSANTLGAGSTLTVEYQLTGTAT